jgi:pyruvate formate-lyase activating enzyme-like uncharacterized protein
VPLERDPEARARRVEALVRQLADLGARIRNDGKSIAYGPLSPACERCRTGERSLSQFLSLACNRKCWFCFNPNQHDWETYRASRKEWDAEMQQQAAYLGGLDFIALTGGEPLLFPDETLRYFETARSRYPDAHKRLYTSGDGATPELLSALGKAGLDEIRFSVKLDEGPAAYRSVLASIADAVGVIPAVMVEMPVVPGTHDQMTALLQRLDEIGVFGINLLELCFPLHNAKAYRARGLRVVKDPYRIPYDYGYAGAIPVAESEELTLTLMREQIERGTSLGLHYCSLENKNTAQVFEQNEGGRLAIPNYRFSSRSFFYETIRLFEDDARRAIAALEAAGLPFGAEADGEGVSFDPDLLPCIADELEGASVFLASAVIERDEQGRRRFREVGLQVVG